MDEVFLQVLLPSPRSLPYPRSCLPYFSQVYGAMAYHVMQANMNRRLNTVSL
ncbi:hypothetical protein B0H12DRAFT_1124242 [Mycena haematopus]|nr:hypothetical protein B0H12DRAFT_1124242 [Mycena haematopus]